jgi:hypothetical protein
MIKLLLEKIMQEKKKITLVSGRGGGLGFNACNCTLGEGGPGVPRVGGWGVGSSGADGWGTGSLGAEERRPGCCAVGGGEKVLLGAKEQRPGHRVVGPGGVRAGGGGAGVVFLSVRAARKGRGWFPNLHRFIG